MSPGEECPPGTEITTEARCRDAADWYLALSLNPQRSLQVKSWPDVPYQCSAIRSDEAFHFNTNAQSTNSRQLKFSRICEKKSDRKKRDLTRKVDL